MITLSQAHAHLRLTGVFTLNTSPQDPRQADLELKLAQAKAIVLDYLKNQAPNDSPAIDAAVLLMLTHLWDHRGEDMADDERLWEAIGRMLARLRDPAVA